MDISKRTYSVLDEIFPKSREQLQEEAIRRSLDYWLDQTSVSNYNWPIIEKYEPPPPPPLPPPIYIPDMKVDMDKLGFSTLPDSPPVNIYALWACGVFWSFMALCGIVKLLTRIKCNRRGAIPATSATAFQRARFANLKHAASGEPPVENDLPPRYSDCSPCRMNKCVDERPPPYEADQQPRQDAFINHERNACAEDHTPDMKTELVFDNGRVVERLSLQLNKETGGASDDEIEVQSTRVTDITDKVMFVNETGNIKRDTQ